MIGLWTWGAPTAPPKPPRVRLAPALPGRSCKHFVKLERSVRLAAIVAVVLALAPAGYAHSLLLSSIPKADAVVDGAPAVTLRFNNRIEKKLSHIRLVSPRGEAQALPVRTGGDVDALEAPLPPLAAGRYRVDWRVLSTDGHVVSGTFAFSVSP